MSGRGFFCLLVLVLAGPGFSAAVSDVAGADWPTWQYDAARSGETPAVLPEELFLQWVRELPRPRRAWPPQPDDRGKLDFDVSWSPVVADGLVFVPSNVTDSVTAYRVDDGEEAWRFYAGGPVRLAPAAWQGRLYFVADDGCLYCLSTADGTLEWKFRAGPGRHYLLGNERLISFWAARGAPVIKDGTVYFAAGLWPQHGVFIYALEAATGAVQWVNDTTGSAYVDLPHSNADGYGGLVPQGYLAAAADRLVVPGGRTPPVYLDRRTGRVESFGFRSKGGGGWAVHAVGRGGTGRRPGDRLAGRLAAVSGQVEGAVFETLAAAGRLFVTTDSGRLYCFGPGQPTPRRHQYRPAPLETRTGAWGETAVSLLNELGESGGYALMAGSGSGELLWELLLRGDQHIVVLEPDPARASDLRDRLVRAGLYGRRAAVIEVAPADFTVQPYLFSLVVSEDLAVAGEGAAARLLEGLRPYGGVAWLGAAAPLLPGLVAAAEAAAVDRVAVEARPGHLFARRDGPLTGAGQWTHQAADAANSNFSPDRLARAPLGVLWFGGPCHGNILPRHGHGPVPQVAGGRVILPGVDTLSARCAYTGRQLWERTFPGLGHPFTDLALEERYRAGRGVHMHNANGLGANMIGSPFVSLADAVYVRYRARIYRLDPATGDTRAVFSLPVAPELAGRPDWGHLSVRGDMLITTVEPQVFTADCYREVFAEMSDVKSRTHDATSSRRLVVMDRHSGRIRWSRQAETGFRHNAIVSGNGRLFLVDGLSDHARDLLERRGREVPAPALLALDLADGRRLWRREEAVFATWLGYAEEHDVLVRAGRPGGLRQLRDEPRGRIAACRGASGEELWDEPQANYGGPLSIAGTTIYLAAAGRRGAGRALDLLTGAPERRGHSPEESVPWTYVRRYGCNTQNVSTHLITFRTGAAGYFDLAHDSGTGNFSGFRSGCTNNLVVADGLVNAPDYTRTCYCSYAHQTSLALVPMPADDTLDTWTRFDAALPDPAGHGLNFGAPGNRVDAAGGRIWYPAPGSGRRHPAAAGGNGAGPAWVFASWLEFTAETPAVEVADLSAGAYRLRFHFAEPDPAVKAGERVFDVLVNGRAVISALDIAARTGGHLRGLVEEVEIDSGDGLAIELRRAGGARREPVISGVEFLARH